MSGVDRSEVGRIHAPDAAAHECALRQTPHVVDSAALTAPPIEDYAIIGDCQSAALVSRGGSIDWLCWPRFDSPAMFCGLLDPQRGGHFHVRPVGVSRVTRSYVGDSAVLRTSFSTDSGDFELTDAMPIYGPADTDSTLLPEHEIVRVMKCTRGEGEVLVDYQPRTGFAQWNDKLVDRRKFGIRVTTSLGILTLISDLDMVIDKDRNGATGKRHLAAGESIHMSLTWSANAPGIFPPVGDWTSKVIERTLRLWREWSSRTRYEGRYREQVMRSAIIVRLLSFAPSGATVAAATSSLPEKRGGRNNWDYRFCWLRDAAFTVRGMLELGHAEEAIGFENWLLHATRLTHPRLMVLYDIYGRPPPPECAVPHLSGYQGALPVQTGNGADGQVQLDSYGEVIDAVWEVTRSGRPLDREAGDAIEALGRYVCKHWQEPDAGIWEPRGEPQRNTHSLVLCWTALDRLIDLQDRGELRPRHRGLFNETRELIRHTVETRGYNETLGSYTATLDGNTLDATALLFGWCGFADPGCARMRSTCKALLAELSPQPGLLFRNRQAGDDGAFGICCFWLAEHLAQGGGSLEEARASFEATLVFGNDVGIFAEQIEPGTGAALGNVPQTFTHVGLINAALALVKREKSDAQTTKEVLS